MSIQRALLTGLFAVFTLACWSLLCFSPILTGDDVNYLGGIVGVALLIAVVIVGLRADRRDRQR